MQLKLNLFAKAIILVAFPVVCELGFTCGLFGMVQQLDQRAITEHRSREALASLNSIYERITEASKLVATIFTTNGVASVMTLHELTAPIPGDVSNLRNQFDDDPTAMDTLDRLEKDLGASLRILDEVFAEVEGGDRLGAVQRLRSLKHAIPDLTEQLNQLRTRCTKDADYNFEQQRAERRRIEVLLKYAIAFNVVLAIGVTFLFHRNITSRLAVVMENTRRLALGKALLAPVGGGDEISHLDKVFKDMSVALEMAHKKERAVIETMPAGLIMTGASGVIQMINPTTARLFDQSAEEVIGRHLCSLFMDERRQTPDQFLAELLSKGKERVEERVAQRMNGAGGTFPVELSVTSFSVYGEEYHLVVMLDISERKEIERLKQEFVSMVSHDLRTPLTSIQVFLNMLCKGMLGQINESVQKKASMADKNATRLINLINDLLDVDKMESGQLALSCQDCALSNVIERSIDSVRGVADQNGITIESDVSEEVLVHADSDRLVQVMVNLLGNAVKFSAKGAKVRIVVEGDGEAVAVKVIDQGRGVPENLRGAIFERFQQVSTKDATEKKGTGLGLAICKAIVEQHGGTIGCHPAEAEGSVFWFRLPVLKPAEILAR